MLILRTRTRVRHIYTGSSMSNENRPKGKFQLAQYPKIIFNTFILLDQGIALYFRYAVPSL